MNGYHISLYLHLLALVVASGISAIVHLAHARARDATSVAEARLWFRLAGTAAKRFPLATLTLVASGAYMVSVNSPWSWHTGWVDAGLTGALCLTMSGLVLKKRGARAGRALAGIGAGDVALARALVGDPVVSALSWANTGVALGIVFAMAVKPALPVALLALVVGGAAGLGMHVATTRKAGAGATMEAELAV